MDSKRKCLNLLKQNLLVITSVLGAGLGFAIGFGVRSLKPSENGLMWIGIVGELYLRMLKMMIVPLIIASVITGTSSLDPKSNGKISAVSLTYIVITNFCGALTGCLMCVAIRPVGDTNYRKIERVTMETQDIFADLLRNLLPDNLFEATFRQALTKHTYETVLRNITVNGTLTVKAIEEVTGKYVGTVNSPNILGLIIASAVFGIATSKLKAVGEPFRLFFSSSTEIIMQIMKWFIWSTPLGVASLIARNIAGTENIAEDFRTLAMYLVTVMCSLLLFNVFVLSIAYLVVKRRNPFRFMFSLIQPVLITFATSSTAIAIPESLKSLEGWNKVDRRITRFVVPFSSTLGRSGSVAYISASCIYIMQMVLPETEPITVVLVCILSTCSSLAIPDVAGASLITVIILLTALGIPAETAALLFTLEWLLDPLRTTGNCLIQCFGSVVTYEVCRSSLSTLDTKRNDTGSYVNNGDAIFNTEQEQDGNKSGEHDTEFSLGNEEMTEHSTHM